MLSCDLAAGPARLTFEAAELPPNKDETDEICEDNCCSPTNLLASPTTATSLSAVDGAIVKAEPPHKQSTIYMFLILPSILAIFGFWVLGEPLTALIIFHFGLVFFSLRYLKNSPTNYFEGGLLANPKTQKFYGALIAIGLITFELTTYSMMPVIFPGIHDRITLPFSDHPVWYLVLMGLEFALLNPIIEQWYWNIFLARTIGHVHKKKKRHYFKLEVFFASYHFFNLLYIFDLPVACVGTCMLVFAGVCLLLIRRFIGFSAAVLAHFGADLGILICFIDIIYRKVSKEH